MELPSFVEDALRYLRRKFFATPNGQSMELYTLTLRNPLARPITSSVAKQLPPMTTKEGITKLNLPHDELTRYRMVGMHLWILHKVLLTSLGPAESQAEFLRFQPYTAPAPALTSRQDRLIFYLFEHFWADLTPYLKEARGEIRLTKTIRSVQEYFYGAFVSMDLAWAGGVDGKPVSEAAQREFLAAALWRNYWLSDTTADKRDVYRLVYYIQCQMRHLSSLPKDDLWLAESIDSFDWLSVSAIFDASGANSDQVLAQKLGITPAAWANSSFATWQENALEGATIEQ